MCELDASNLNIAIVKSDFNFEISNLLYENTKSCLLKHNLSEDNLFVYSVPGAFEIGAVVAKLAEKKTVDAIICLGVIIKGETSHDYYIANSISNNLFKLSMKYRLPIIFGVLTCNTIEQAMIRAGANNTVNNLKSEQKDKDRYATVAIRMANLLKNI